jgi:hypothetical protein
MSAAQTDAWSADFGIGIGAAAIVAGGVLFAMGAAHYEDSRAHDLPPPQASWGFRFVSAAHGGEAFITRSF